MRMVEKKTAACRAAVLYGPAPLRQLRQQRLCLGFLLVVALVEDFLQDFARALDVAHFLIRLSQVELGRGIVPLAIEYRRCRILERRALRVEGEVELIEFDGGSGTRELRCGRAGSDGGEHGFDR